MTTAQEQRRSADENIGRVVEILLAYKQESLTELTVATGIGKSTMIRRRNTGGWSAAEVATLAEHFDVPVSVLYDGPDALIARTSRFSRPLPNAVMAA